METAYEKGLRYGIRWVRSMLEEPGFLADAIADPELVYDALHALAVDALSPDVREPWLRGAEKAARAILEDEARGRKKSCTDEAFLQRAVGLIGAGAPVEVVRERLLREGCSEEEIYLVVRAAGVHVRAMGTTGARRTTGKKSGCGCGR